MGGGALGSKVSRLVGKEVRRNFSLALLGRADLRTDGAKRVRIANRLSGMHVSAKAKLCERGANPRQGVRRTGEGSKVKIAQLVRDDMSIQVFDSETDKKLDCHVADAPRNDNKINPRPLREREKFLSEQSEHRNLGEGGKMRSRNCVRDDRFLYNFAKPCHRALDARSISKSCKVAFTLAEVLITLGIIGVVAAITLPSVINDFRQKQLHTAFLRSSSMIQNALNQTASEYGYTNYKELNSICGKLGKNDAFSACRQENQALFEEICSDFLSRFKILKSMKATQFWYLGNNTTNFSGTTKFNYGDLYGVTGWSNPRSRANAYLLSDGTMISSIAFYYHEPSDGLSISFDTNGPYKGPNRYGYDIFLFNTGTWYKYCSKKSDGIQGLYNGRGCYDYALKDVNPDDSTKGYWESLYK